MLLSMTGYGQASQTIGSKTISVEIRSLNSKFTDVRFKVPNNLREKEPELKKRLVEMAERGKMDLSIDIQSLAGDAEYAINESLFRSYFRQLSALAKELHQNEADLMQAILKIPNVINNAENSIDDSEWEAVQTVFEAAYLQFVKFREAEGDAMERDLRLRIQTIQELLEQIDPFESNRIEKLRTRMRNHLEEYLGKENIDENRFEQEVLFYLEKIDINEEKVRLAQHCLFFLEQLDKKVTQKGRKLSFISQEMGREINTLGAKAYSSDIQRIVVAMKDELEKVKEQVANLV